MEWKLDWWGGPSRSGRARRSYAEQVGFVVDTTQGQRREASSTTPRARLLDRDRHRDVDKPQGQSRGSIVWRTEAAWPH